MKLKKKKEEEEESANILLCAWLIWNCELCQKKKKRWKYTYENAINKIVNYKKKKNVPVHL